MSNDNKKTALPKLRFPEFREAAEWRTEPFKDLYTFQGTNSFSRDKLNYKEGTVKNIHYGDIHTKFSTLFDITKEKVPFVNTSVPLDKIKEENYCVEGDLIFADASEDLNDIGKSIEVVNLNGEKVLSGLHTQFARQKKQKLVVGFAGHLFMSSAIRSQIQNESQGTKVLGISAGRLSKIDVCYPGDKREQQKIAATLSSLDDLLTAQSTKLEALKAHKRGLMQALFPAEGETVPKLRFPEFQEAQEWEQKKLGEFAKVVASGDLDFNLFSPLKTTSHPYPVYSNAVEKEGIYGYYSTPKYLANSLTITARGTLGVAFSRNESFMGIGRLIVVSQFENVNSFFLKECWNHCASVPHEVTSIPQLTAVTAKSISLPLPTPAEQQKIADCLSSLDNRITAQSQKIEALKLHKKGLMQHLFPAAAEPTA